MRIRGFLTGAAAALVVAGLGTLGFIHSGIYNIAATDAHNAIERWALTTLQTHSVRRDAKGIAAPPLGEAALVRDGFEQYERHCTVCHGAPGVAAGSLGRGMNPKPPRLAEAAKDWSDAELYWIVRNGLRMAGMPGFEATFTEREVWAVVAFLRRQQELELADYAAMRAAAEGHVDPRQVRWVTPVDAMRERLTAEGDAERGRSLVRRYGCVTCHALPGAEGPSGIVGPPLTGWSRRHYIAGRLLNRPTNLVAWIRDPQAVEPGTAMPTLGVGEADAVDIAAYLYSLR